MIGKLLGHKNVETTARYAHLMSDPMKEAAESVSAQIGALMAIPKYAPPPAAVHKTRATAQILTFIPKTNIPMPVYLTSDQAAHYLGLPPESMKDWRYRKLGPRFTKVANRVRYSQADLDEYFKCRPIGQLILSAASPLE